MELSFKTTGELKTRLLIHEAKTWLRFTEAGGDNKGQAVEAFQRAVDGEAVGEPWCMSFVQYCIKQVDLLVDEIAASALAMKDRSQLYKTEHCLSCWASTPHTARMAFPMPGTIMIWQYGSTSSGHTGIVVSIDKYNPDHVWTIEGNTGPGEVVKREGDGVYLKRRTIKGSPSMKVKGWLNPWL